MELFQLEQFKAIADNGNMLRASKELYISQPALSKNLINLETELGCKLFDRIGKRLVINEYGVLLLEHVNNILKDLNKLKSSFENKLNDCHTITFIAPNEYFFRIFLKDFINLHNNIMVKAHTLKNKETYRAMIDNKADVIIAYENKDENNFSNRIRFDKDIERVYLYNIRMFLSVPFESPYAEKDEITLKEISRIPLVRVGESSGVETWVDQILERDKMHLNVIGMMDQTTIDSIIFSSDYNILISSLNIDGDNRYRTHRKLINISDEIASKNLYLYYNTKNKNACMLAKVFMGRFYA